MGPPRGVHSTTEGEIAPVPRRAAPGAVPVSCSLWASPPEQRDAEFLRTFPAEKQTRQRVAGNPRGRCVCSGGSASTSRRSRHVQHVPGQGGEVRISHVSDAPAPLPPSLNTGHPTTDCVRALVSSVHRPTSSRSSRRPRSTRPLYEHLPAGAVHVGASAAAERRRPRRASCPRLRRALYRLIDAGSVHVHKMGPRHPHENGRPQHLPRSLTLRRASTSTPPRRPQHGADELAPADSEVLRVAQARSFARPDPDDLDPCGKGVSFAECHGAAGQTPPWRCQRRSATHRYGLLAKSSACLVAPATSRMSSAEMTVSGVA